MLSFCNYFLTRKKLQNMKKINWLSFHKWFKRMLLLLIAAFIILVAYEYWGEQKFEKFKESERKRIKALVIAAQEQSISDQLYAKPRLRGNTMTDPASKKKIVESVNIQSEDGLCSITLLKSLDGLIDNVLVCKEISIRESYHYLTIKFDTEDNAYSEFIDNFKNSNVKGTFDISHEKLRCSNWLALKIPAFYSFWTRFDLTGTSTPIGQLGKTRDFQPSPCRNGKPAFSDIVWLDDE